MYYIYEEIGVKGEHGTLHRVYVPNPGEKGFYITISSLSGFNHGRRKGATESEKKKHQDGCCWTPSGLLYYGRREEYWLKQQERLAERLPTLDRRNEPMIEHKSLWDFYTYIGFDYKKRKYVA